MPGAWGTTVSKGRLGAFWTGFELSADGSKGRLVGAKVRLSRDSGFKDNSPSRNWLSVIGVVGTDAVVEAEKEAISGLTGTGERDLMTCAGQWVDLQYDTQVTRRFSASLMWEDTDWRFADVIVTVAYPLRPPELKPGAPSLTVTPLVLDATTTALVASFVHNPVDGSAQTGYKLRYSLNGANSWTELTGAKSTSHAIAAGTLANNKAYEIQACTRGADPAWGAWSPSVVVQTVPTPVVTITPPAVGASRLDAAWTSTATPAEWVATLYGPDLAVIEQRSGTGPALTVTLSTVLDDATSYTLGVAVRNGLGLWSAEARTTWTTDLIRPPAPTLAATWDDTLGQVALTVTTPPPAGGQPAPVTVEIWRDGALIGTTDPTSTYLDPIPPTNTTVTYQAIAWADPPVSAASAPCPIGTPAPAWVYVNFGPAWRVQARLKLAAKVSLDIDRPKELHTWEGHQDPDEFIGQAVKRRWRITGKVDGYGRHPELGEHDPFELLATAPAPICVRDPIRRHRIFGSVSNVTIDHATDSSLAVVAFTITAVGASDDL